MIHFEPVLRTIRNEWQRNLTTVLTWLVKINTTAFVPKV